MWKKQEHDQQKKSVCCAGIPSPKKKYIKTEDCVIGYDVCTVRGHKG